MSFNTSEWITVYIIFEGEWKKFEYNIEPKLIFGMPFDLTQQFDKMSVSLPRSKTKRIFLISNYNGCDRRKIIRMINSLGGEDTDLTDEFNATHLVAPYFRSTSKMMAALAAGIWIVQTSYVLRSYEIGQWVFEEEYEIGSETCAYSVLREEESIPYMKELENAPKICRERCLVRKRRNFSDWKIALVIEDPSKLLYTKRILLAGGAFVLVLDLPINVDDVDLEFIDFAVVGVENYTSLAPLKKLNIRCVFSSYVTDVLCMDPPPDIKLYDCHTRTVNEKCFIKRSKNFKLNTCQSSEVKEHTRTCFKTRKNKNEVENTPANDNFQITVKRSGSFLMNSAVSIILDTNHEHNSKEEVCSADQNVYDVETVDSIGNSTECTKSFKMGLYHNLHNSPKKSYWKSSRIKKRDVANSYQKKSPQKRSPKKVFSPKYDMSCFKKRKSISPQKSKILKYFINSEKPDFEDEESASKRRYSTPSFSSNSVTDKECVNLCEYNSVKRTCNDCNSSVDQRSLKNCEPEVIVISSDEDDLEIGSESAINRVKISKESIKEVVSYNFKTELIEEKDLRRENDYHCEGNSLDIIRKLYDSDSEECVVLSDEEKEVDPFLSFKGQTIDLTYDDECAIDEAGAVIVPESKQSITNSLNENDSEGSDEDDNCVTKRSFKDDLILEKQRENYVEKDFDDCVIQTILPPPTLKEMGVGSDSDGDVEFIEVLQMKNNTAGESILKDKSLDHQCSPPKFNNIYGEYNENEIHTIIDDAPLNLEENAENIKALSSDKEDVSSDSSLPSPPKIFAEDLTKVKRRQLSYEPKSIINISNEIEVYNELNVTEDNLIEILQNKIFSSNPDLHVSQSKCGNDTYLNDSPAIMKTGIQCVQQASSKETGMESHYQTINPSATRVCEVQAEVLLSKLYQPWLHSASHYVSKCCVMGPTECANLHGKKMDFPEEADFSDESLIVRMDSGLDAVDLLQSRIDFATYPSPITVQYVLLCCMDIWEEGVLDALDWLYQLLDEHPPCAFGMLDYYKKIFFGPVENMDASDGTFWVCITKIEEIMEAIEKEEIKTSNTSKTDGNSYQFIDEFLETFDSSSKKNAPEINHHDKLENLFGVFEFMISVMEADLNIGILKHISNLKQYTYKTGKPIIGVALWGTHGNVGTVNVKCRHMFKMYFKILQSFHSMEYKRNFKRLISLMASVTYASERNSEPPKYPNVEINCKEFASSFASVLMGSELNLAEVPVILNTLRPDWFRMCVCSKLLENLTGQNMELSLQPTVHLLRKLCSLNYDFPSEEEISNTFLRDPVVESVTTEDSETLPPKFISGATKKDKKGETRLHIACRRNNVSEVEKLLNVPSIKVNEEDNFGWTPLHEAAFHGSVECVRKLLNYKSPSGSPAVNLRAKNHVGITPLMDAVSRNHLAIAAELLQYGGQALLTDKSGADLSPLDLAVTEEMKNILMSASEATKNDLLGIPRSLFIKLVVLTPAAIGFYIKFSEVTKIVKYLKNNTELTRDPTSLVKFQPVAFKRDYLEFRKLQTLIQEYKGNKIAESLILFT